MPWPSCSPYRQNMPTGAQRCPKAYATAPRPRHSKPWSTSISMLSQTSTCRADTDATEKGTMKHHKGLASFNPNQRRLTKRVLDEVKVEPTCRHLMTVPGVGPL